MISRDDFAGFDLTVVAVLADPFELLEFDRSKGGAGGGFAGIGVGVGTAVFSDLDDENVVNDVVLLSDSLLSSCFCLSALVDFTDRRLNRWDGRRSKLRLLSWRALFSCANCA